MPANSVIRAQVTQSLQVFRIAMPGSSEASLSDRFKALQTSALTEQQDPETMTLEELSIVKINFGEAKRGQTFREVLQSDPKYVSWVLSRYQESTKHSHKMFVSYLRRCIEAEEDNRGVTSDQPRVPTKGYPKAKAGMTSRPATTEENTVGLTEGMWDMVEEDHENHLRDAAIEQQNQRITQMEQMMQQLLQVLTPTVPQLEPSVGATENKTT